jgi:chitin disaccharide deacetylase
MLLAAGESSGLHAVVEHSQRRTICIAVDDFGLHDGINQAALELAALGHAQAIGCMVGGPAWRNGSRTLRRFDARQLDLGLHLDLTECTPLRGTRRPLASLILDAYVHRLDGRAVRAEIKTQLDAFEHALGRSPAYIDGHQHVHQLPVVRDELLQELAERYGECKPWLRCTRRPRDLPAALGSRMKPWLIEQLGAAGLTAMALRAGHAQNARLLGVYDFRGGAQPYRRRLAAWLSVARHGDLLMCHPSVAVAPCTDSLIDARLAEYQVLSAPSFAAQLRDAAIDTRPMSAILAEAPLQSGAAGNTTRTSSP